jgi:hypothetical protein
MRRVVIIAAALLIIGCHRPPLRITTHGASVTVDAQTFGEYPSDVERLRLTDASTHRVVWEVKGHGAPQIGKFVLNAGENVATISDVRHGAFDVIMPVGKQTFTLASGGTYVIEAWGRDGDARTKREAEFTLPRITSESTNG